MKIATFCLLAFCVYEIVHAKKDNKDVQKKLDELMQNDTRSSQLYDFLNKKGKKTDGLLAAAKQAKKNTVGCQQDYDDTKYAIYLDFSNACGDCVIHAKKINNYQAAVDCCDKLYKESISKSDQLVKDAKYCLDGL